MLGKSVPTWLSRILPHRKLPGFYSLCIYEADVPVVVVTPFGNTMASIAQLVRA